MSELKCSRTCSWSTVAGLISMSVMLMTAAAVVLVIRVLIDHVMLVVVTAASVVAVDGAAGGCSNLITSIGIGKDPGKVPATHCKTHL